MGSSGWPAGFYLRDDKGLNSHYKFYVFYFLVDNMR